MPRTLKTHIHYTSRKEGREGQERGREFNTMLVHEDGSRTLQSHCEIDDAPAVLRLVTLTVGPDYAPRDGHVAIWVGGKAVGSTWYAFGADHALAEGLTSKEGRISQRFETPKPLAALGTHPLQGDAWVMAGVGLEGGFGPKRVELMVTSLDHRGATGPTLVPIWLDLTYKGECEVTVQAGTFKAHHFLLGQEGNYDPDDPVKHPVYNVWVSADGDALLLRGVVEGYMQTEYELVRLERS